MYLGLQMKGEQQQFTNNFQRIATPVLGFLSGKCRAVYRVIRAASFLPVYLCVSHTEALLMASSTSYLSVYKVASFVTYECLAVLVPNLGYEGSTLFCS
jgi:hypothetical protein